MTPATGHPQPVPFRIMAAGENLQETRRNLDLFLSSCGGSDLWDCVDDVRRFVCRAINALESVEQTFYPDEEPDDERRPADPEDAAAAASHHERV